MPRKQEKNKISMWVLNWVSFPGKVFPHMEQEINTMCDNAIKGQKQNELKYK